MNCHETGYNHDDDGAPEAFCTCEEFALCAVCLAERHKARERVLLFTMPAPAARPVYLEEDGSPLMYADGLATELAIDDALMERPCGARNPARKPPARVVSIGPGMFVRVGRRK